MHFEAIPTEKCHLYENEIWCSSPNLLLAINVWFNDLIKIVSKTVLCNVILLQVKHTHFSKGTCKIIQNIYLDCLNIKIVLIVSDTLPSYMIH